MSNLSQFEHQRYVRQLPVIGIEGQQLLKQAKILCVGAGGLAAGVLPYLAASGVGKLGIVDGDNIELSNLQRQILFKEAQIGQSKAQCAAEYLRSLNTELQITAISEFLTEANAAKIIEDFDIVIDATDNFAARYLLNRVTRSKNLPLISASIFQFEAQLSVFNYKNGPCYECLYPQQPQADAIPNCAQAGVLGVLPGVIGALQASEAIKLILRKGDILSGKLLYVNLLSLNFTQYDLHKNANCEHEHGMSPPIPAPSMPKKGVQELTCLKLEVLLEQNPDSITLVDVRESYERQICHIGGIHIPLGDFVNKLSTIPQHKPVVLYCRSGMRSMQAATVLQKTAFAEAIYNLEGGILDWIDTVDPSLDRY